MGGIFLGSILASPSDYHCLLYFMSDETGTHNIPLSEEEKYSTGQEFHLRLTPAKRRTELAMANHCANIC